MSLIINVILLYKSLKIKFKILNSECIKGLQAHKRNVINAFEMHYLL